MRSASRLNPPPALRGDPHLDHRAHRGGCCFMGKIEHRTPAEEDFILLQLIQVLIDLGIGQTRDLGDLRGRELAAFEQELENWVHRGGINP